MKETDPIVRQWAAAKLGVPDRWEAVTVDIEHERATGGGCETCGYGGDWGELSILMYVEGEEREYLDIENVKDFGALIRELAAFTPQEGT